MLPLDTIREHIGRLFPVTVARHTLYLVEGGDAVVAALDGHIRATLRLVSRDEDGSIRDVREQEMMLLSPALRSERGLAVLSRATRSISDVEAYLDLDSAMPADLLEVPLALHELDDEAFERVVRDERARHILMNRRDDAALLATLDPAKRRASPSLSNPELEAQVLQSDEDRAAFAVYGDWLSERGDPRGELVAIQLAIEDRPDDVALRSREAELVSHHAWEWLGGLAWAPLNEVECVWRNGFLRKVRFGTEENAGLEVSSQGTAFEIASLARLPGLAFLDTIELWPKSFDGSFEEAAAAIAEHGVPPNLRLLALKSSRYLGVGEIEQAYPKLDRLRELFIDSRSMELGEIVLPALRSFEIVTRGLTRDNLDSIREAQWPELERLVLCVGETGIDDCDVELSDLEWIAAGEGLPHVVHLGLAGADAHELARLLLGSAILPRLRTLDLSRGTMGEGGIPFLREHAAAFGHLAALHVPRGFRDVGLDELVRALPCVVVDERFIPVGE